MSTGSASTWRRRWRAPGHNIDMTQRVPHHDRQDPVLRHVKLIAEPWDASMDGYRVGSFPPPWVEWNDRYRDTMRDFWLDSGGIRDVASRLAGSSDLYADDGRSPYASVNFLTAHDGFTVRDLVSYNAKHNEDNGEHNRDGTDNNRSWNHGVEGETDDPEIRALRRRQAANLMVDPVPVERLADDHRRRRAWPDPAREQQRLRPGQRALLGRLASRRRLARRLRHHQGRAPTETGASRASAAPPLRRHPVARRRAQGPGLDASRRARDGGAGLVRLEPARGRHVRVRRSTALPRSARRAAARQLVPDLAELGRRAGVARAPARRLGEARRGGAVHRRSRSRPGPPCRPATPSPSPDARYSSSARTDPSPVS